MGSLAFAAAARAVWAVTRHPDDPSGKSRLLIPVKNNLGNDQSGYCYIIETDRSGRPVLAWDATPVAISADDALSRQVRRDERRTAPALNEAVEWLTAALADGPRLSAELLDEAVAQGITPKTLHRARKELSIKPRRIGFGADGCWEWELPTATADVGVDPF